MLLPLQPEPLFFVCIRYLVQELMGSNIGRPLYINISLLSDNGFTLDALHLLPPLLPPLTTASTIASTAATTASPVSAFLDQFALVFLDPDPSIILGA
jgi:hypothetical protein